MRSFLEKDRRGMLGNYLAYFAQLVADKSFQWIQDKYSRASMTLNITQKLEKLNEMRKRSFFQENSCFLAQFGTFCQVFKKRRIFYKANQQYYWVFIVLDVQLNN